MKYLLLLGGFVIAWLTWCSPVGILARVTQAPAPTVAPVVAPLPSFPTGQGGDTRLRDLEYRVCRLEEQLSAKPGVWFPSRC
jgi:hypothetical protein